jgi:hypothetical protein
VSICFNCLFLGFFFHYYCFVCFPPKRKKKEIETIYFRVVCVCVSQRDLFDVCLVKKRERRKNKGDGIPCVFMLSNYLSTFSFYFFCELMLCFFLCCRLFPYLFIKRFCVCVCVSFYYLLCVCV